MKVYTGTVMHGSKRASDLGFPTVNIPLNDASVSGIYAATALVHAVTYEAAAFVDTKRNILEAYLLNFSGDAYGAQVTLTLVQKLRGAQTFPDDASLKDAIARDIEAVRNFFSKK